MVVNCIGLVKHLRQASDAVPTLTLNALFPHRLYQICSVSGARLIHIGTDCVFSGRRGGYCEDDLPNAEDPYGRSKLLGEVAGPGCLTIRTSIVGREASGSHGLLEWLVGQRGKTVRGWSRAVFSGLTTRALSSALGDVIAHHQSLAGLYHMASEPIDKLSLLNRFRDALALEVAIEPDVTVRIDRSLDGSRFRQATGLVMPSWETMVGEVATDATPCASIRSGAC
ncbi:MAG: sugar nucleotide-binding protein [Chloroflexota bacterium]